MCHHTDPMYPKVKADAIALLSAGGISITKAAVKLKLDRGTLGLWAKEAGLVFIISDKKPINSKIFNVIDTEEKAYWLGFLYADGCVSDNNNVEVALKLSDEGHIIRFSEFLSFKGNIYKDDHRARLCFKDIQIGNDLKRLGCFPRKSLILNFPSNNQVPPDLTNHFIRGYFDGDGSIKNPVNCPFGASLIGTKQFLTQVLHCIGIPSSLRVKNSKGSQFVFQFQLTGRNSRLFLSYIYRDATIFLQRKMDRYQNHLIKFSKRHNYLCQ